MKKCFNCLLLLYGYIISWNYYKKKRKDITEILNDNFF